MQSQKGCLADSTSGLDQPHIEEAQNRGHI